MKLVELQGVKNQADKSLADLLADLIKPGSKFQKVGSGIAAEVLLHENGLIYKFWAQDSAYEKFISYVEKNQNDPHLPKLKSKIKELTSFFDHPEEFPKKIKYVKMEELKPINYDSKFFDTKQLYITDVIDYLGVNAADGNIKSFDLVIREFESDEECKLSPKAVQEIKSLSTTLTNIVKLKLAKYLDIHSGNIMLRGNTIVIIDPAAEKKDIEFNRALRNQLKLGITKLKHYESEVEISPEMEKAFYKKLGMA